MVVTVFERRDLPAWRPAFVLLGLPKYPVGVTDQGIVPWLAEI